MEWMTTEAAIKFDRILLGRFQMVAPYSIVDLARDI
jgi:hypothetical protein